MTLLVDLAIRSSVMLAAGLLLSACLAKRSAALRHRVLAGALLGAPFVVLFSRALPGWDVQVPGAWNAPVSHRAIVGSSAPTPPLNVRAEASAPATPVAPAPESVSPFVVTWLAGVAVAAGMLMAGVVRIHRVAARGSRVEDRRWLEVLDAVAGRYGLRRGIAISRTDSPDLLATWGMLRPRILVPRQARTWTLDRVHVVLCHELAHIRRHDWFVQMGAEALRAILWFNPLAWIVCRRLRRESEQACDDEVLGIGVDGHDYAAHLLDLARQCRRSRSAWASAMPMAHPSTLERRIAAMLNPRLDRRVPSVRSIAMIAAVLLLVALPVAILHARQAGPAPLTGTIYDPTGAVMPGVEVQLVDANEVASTTTSDGSGRFEFPAVTAGKYTLRASLPGFRTLHHELELSNARDWSRVIMLQVGELQETISVRETRVTTAGKPSPLGAGSVRVGGNIRAPKKVLDVRPVYPPAMRAGGLTGVVPLEAIIGRDGLVSSVRVLSAQVHPDFAIAAVDAVRQWRFSPTLLNGEPVEVVMTVRVRFDLDE